MKFPLATFADFAGGFFNRLQRREFIDVKQTIPSRFIYQPACVSPSKGSNDDFAAQVRQKLSSREYATEPTRCPCGAQTGDIVIAEVDRYGLPLKSVLCELCGTVRFNPYLTPESLKDFYVHFYQQMYKRAADLNRYFTRQQLYGRKLFALLGSTLRPSDWVWEIGCGAGGALSVFQEAGYPVAGCDYSSALIKFGIEKGLDNLFDGPLNKVPGALPKPTVIYMHHVFEHIDDPVASLMECRNRLAPDGRIIIVVPDISNISQSEYPAGDLLQFLHIAHKFNFSYEGIERLCRRAGLSATKLTPDAKVKTPWSHMPELWVEMRIDARPESCTTAIGKNNGRRMLDYLHRTERLRSLGLCRGQLLRKLRRVCSILPK